MRETEKIWMNGELVDWADATVHVGTHGLHYGSGVFEGIRAYETRPRHVRLPARDHLERLQHSAQLLYMDLPYSVEELRTAAWDLIGANGLPSCYLRPIAFFGYGELGVSAQGNPVDVVIMSLAVGRVPRRGRAEERHPRQDLELAARRPERDPARREGDRRLPQLDARRQRGEPRRLRRGDHAHRRGHRRGRLRREPLRRAGRRHLHAGPLRLDPRRASRATR